MMGASGAVRGASVAMLGWLLAAQPAQAQQATTEQPAGHETGTAPSEAAPAEQTARPPLALVVEADVDTMALRAAIAKGLDRPLTTLSRAQAAPEGPTAVLTISIDPEVGISVMLWERGVGTDILSTPVQPKDVDTINAAAALATALVERVTRDQRAALELEANPYLRRLPKAPPRPRISPINPYYRARRTQPSG